MSVALKPDTRPTGAPISVLHVAQPRDAGVAAYVSAASQDQLSRGWQVTVACAPTGWLAEELDRSGVPRVVWPATRSPGTSTPAETRSLRRLLTVTRPDLLHLHSSKAGLTGRLAARGRVPTLFQPHGWSWLAVTGTTARAALGWERLAARWTRSFVCVGEAEARLGFTHGLRGRLEVIRNGVDLRRFRSAGPAARVAARAALGVRLDASLAVCVGRITRQKGQDVLLAAWPAVRQRCPNAELVLVGDGDMVAELNRSYPAGVRFTGPVDDVWQWYAAADVIALPSRWEGAPLTLMEALAVGRPVVASDIPGIADVLPGAAGALVPAQAPLPLAAALAQRLTCPALTAVEGQAAMVYAARHLDARHTFDSLAALGAEVAGTHR